MKTLVAYFTYSGNTERAAKAIASAVGADLFRIRPVVSYPDEYASCTRVAKTEKNTDARPALMKIPTREEFDRYDAVFLGYPIWWYDAPMPVYTFLENVDLCGKLLVPFALSGGSGLCGSDQAVARAAKGATVRAGTLLNGFSDAEIAAWAKKHLNM